MADRLMIIDPVMQCCKEVGVPPVCHGFCMPGVMARSKQPHSDDCKFWINQINTCRKSPIPVTGEAKLHSCCLTHQVPYGCQGMCKGSCEDRPWIQFNLHNHQCSIHVQNVQNCCNMF